MENGAREDIVLAELIEAAQAQTGCTDIGPETRLVQDLNLIGDDMDEFLEGVIERYGADFSGFVWHRHYPDEYTAPYFLAGRFFRRIFHFPPVEYEPITLSRLAGAVTRGQWEYGISPPEPEIPTVNPWLHTAAYILAPVIFVSLGLMAVLYDSSSMGEMLSAPLFYLLAVIVCLSPVAGLSLNIRLYITDPPHRAPTLFMIIVHSLFLALVLFVAGATALGF